MYFFLNVSSKVAQLAIWKLCPDGASRCPNGTSDSSASRSTCSTACSKHCHAVLLCPHSAGREAKKICLSLLSRIQRILDLTNATDPRMVSCRQFVPSVTSQGMLSCACSHLRACSVSARSASQDVTRFAEAPSNRHKGQTI